MSPGIQPTNPTLHVRTAFDPVEVSVPEHRLGGFQRQDWLILPRSSWLNSDSRSSLDSCIRGWANLIQWLANHPDHYAGGVTQPIPSGKLPRGQSTLFPANPRPKNPKPKNEGWRAFWRTIAVPDLWGLTLHRFKISPNRRWVIRDEDAKCAVWAIRRGCDCRPMWDSRS